MRDFFTVYLVPSPTVGLPPTGSKMSVASLTELLSLDLASTSLFNSLSLSEPPRAPRLRSLQILDAFGTWHRRVKRKSKRQGMPRKPLCAVSNAQQRSHIDSTARAGLPMTASCRPRPLLIMASAFAQLQRHLGHCLVTTELMHLSAAMAAAFARRRAVNRWRRTLDASDGGSKSRAISPSATDADADAVRAQACWKNKVEAATSRLEAEPNVGSTTGSCDVSAEPPASRLDHVPHDTMAPSLREALSASRAERLRGSTLAAARDCAAQRIAHRAHKAWSPSREGLVDSVPANRHGNGTIAAAATTDLSPVAGVGAARRVRTEAQDGTVRRCWRQWAARTAALVGSSAEKGTSAMRLGAGCGSFRLRCHVCIWRTHAAQNGSTAHGCRRGVMLPLLSARRKARAAMLRWRVRTTDLGMHGDMMGSASLLERPATLRPALLRWWRTSRFAWSLADTSAGAARRWALARTMSRWLSKVARDIHLAATVADMAQTLRRSTVLGARLSAAWAQLVSVTATRRTHCTLVRRLPLARSLAMWTRHAAAARCRRRCALIGCAIAAMHAQRVVQWALSTRWCPLVRPSLALCRLASRRVQTLGGLLRLSAASCERRTAAALITCAVLASELRHIRRAWAAWLIDRSRRWAALASSSRRACLQRAVASWCDRAVASRRVAATIGAAIVKVVMSCSRAESMRALRIWAERAPSLSLLRLAGRLARTSRLSGSMGLWRSQVASVTLERRRLERVAVVVAMWYAGKRQRRSLAHLSAAAADRRRGADAERVSRRCLAYAESARVRQALRHMGWLASIRRVPREHISRRRRYRLAAVWRKWTACCDEARVRRMSRSSFLHVRACGCACGTHATKRPLLVRNS